MRIPLDHTMIAYIVTFCISMLVLFVLVYGKIARRSSSFAFNALIFLAAGMAVEIIANLFARIQISGGDYSFINSTFWPFRVYPSAIALGYIGWNFGRRLLADCKRAKQAEVLMAKPTENGKPAILVVENYTPTWAVYFAALDKKYDVHFATSYEQALEKIRVHRYRVVIADLLLGKDARSGLDLARAVREIYPMTYLIAATGHHGRFPVDRVTRYFNDVLYKSFTIRLLRCSVALGMKISGRWRELALTFPEA